MVRPLRPHCLREVVDSGIHEERWLLGNVPRSSLLSPRVGLSASPASRACMRWNICLAEQFSQHVPGYDIQAHGLLNPTW